MFWSDSHPTGIDGQFYIDPEGPLHTARTGVQSSLPFSRSNLLVALGNVNRVDEPAMTPEG
ncbi:MAG: hypothetical protein D4R77_12340 [Planctomycetaceae bacterium]|nr:MAG: hypothetical protein D4R77_12340 [Planctomycetaceae bacterium]